MVELWFPHKWIRSTWTYNIHTHKDPQEGPPVAVKEGSLGMDTITQIHLEHDDNIRLIFSSLIGRKPTKWNHFYFAYWSLGKQKWRSTHPCRSEAKNSKALILPDLPCSHSSFPPLCLAHQLQTGLMCPIHQEAHNSLIHSFVHSSLDLWRGTKLNIVEGEIPATLRGSWLTLVSWTTGVQH